MNCIRCQKEGSILLPSLELRTMNVRDMRGHDRYQVPDDAVRTYAVCPDCANAYLAASGPWGARARKKLLGFGLVLAAGIALAILFAAKERVLLMLALAAIFCGAVGLFTTFRDSSKEAATLSALPREEALREAAWQVFLQKAPQSMQDGLWRLSYIPVNEKTLATKPGDLTVIYQILPSVAKEVMVKIGHPQA